MKESFNSIKKEELNKEKIPTSFSDRLYSLREYIKTLPDQAKKAGFIAVLFSMGAFNITEAQNNNSDLVKTIKDLEAGKSKIENAVDSIYSSYRHINNDSTFSYVEYMNSVEGKEEKVDINVSGPNILVDQTGDTISMGDYIAMEYSIVATEGKTNLNNEEFRQEGKYFSAIKPVSSEVNDNTINKGVSHKASGKTEQAAIISAIAGLAAFKNTEIFMVSESTSEQVVLSNGINKEGSGFVELVNSETKETKLNNVKIIVTKTTDGFSVEAFCN